MSGEQLGSKAPKENLLTRIRRRGSISSSSINEHLDRAKTSKEIYSPFKFYFDEQNIECALLLENKNELCEWTRTNLHARDRWRRTF
jgi:hypothetical protein